MEPTQPAVASSQSNKCMCTNKQKGVNWDPQGQANNETWLNYKRHCSIHPALSESWTGTIWPFCPLNLVELQPSHCSFSFTEKGQEYEGQEGEVSCEGQRSSFIPLCLLPLMLTGGYSLTTHTHRPSHSTLTSLATKKTLNEVQMMWCVCAFLIPHWSRSFQAWDLFSLSFLFYFLAQCLCFWQKCFIFQKKTSMPTKRYIFILIKNNT